MKETTIESITTMQTAAGLQTEQTYRTNFDLQREIPSNLGLLDAISKNFYWSWTSEGAELFRELNPTLWEKCEQNPRLLLSKISDLRLWQKANDAAYVERLRKFGEKFNEYVSAEPKSFGAITAQNPIAYFCAEYGVHNSLPIYSGGLGILAGDHLKSASDENAPLIAVGLMYRYGYFRQKISHDGWQTENYLDSFENQMALTPILDQDNQPILISVGIRGREVFAQAWLAQIGRIRLYLLDTNIEKNAEVDRLITGHLYGGDTETRIVQEKVLGIGGVRLLRKLGIEPSVFHLNEGHSAFLNLELAREFLEKNTEAAFQDAVEFVRQQSVFTTHTPVAAGNDSFPPEQIEMCFDTNFINALRISKDEFFKLGRSNPEDAEEWFGMTPLALRMSRSANGVSEKHGEVSRKLWQKMFPDATADVDVPITHITNGVHAPTWIAPALQAVYERQIGSDWCETLKDENAWRAAIERIPDAEIWETHLLLKKLLIAYLREKTLSKEIGALETINEHVNTQKLFSAETLTIGFARRVAAYKRWNLLLLDLDRLIKIISDSEKPVQFVFAGKAHPQDLKAKKLLQKLMTLDENAEWQRRAVFVEDYDQEVARYLVQGVDVWLNVPIRPLEASGTSGQKVAMNGGLNLSILDGWWIEGYNGENGFSIGALGEDDHTAEDNTEQEKINAEDAASLYETLENTVIPTYYRKNEDNLPGDWIRMMRNSLITLTYQFSSDRMLRDYIEKIYLPK